LRELDAYLSHTQTLRDALAAADDAALLALMQRAETARGHWLSGNLQHFNDIDSDHHT
jgi:hypothetical protein